MRQRYLVNCALLLGAKECVGVDIDENSVRISKENAVLNNIYDDRFTVYLGDITKIRASRKKSDTICTMCSSKYYCSDNNGNEPYISKF